jgi:hypothetical protein
MLFKEIAPADDSAKWAILRYVEDKKYETVNWYSSESEARLAHHLLLFDGDD